MEAALRSASFLLTGQNPDPEAFSQLREGPDLREATYDLAGTSGCAAPWSAAWATPGSRWIAFWRARSITTGEVMACPGGLRAAAAGQPIGQEDREPGGISRRPAPPADGQAPCASPTRIPRSRPCTGSFFGKPHRRSPSTCSTVTIPFGPCPTSGKLNNFFSKNSAS